MPTAIGEALVRQQDFSLTTQACAKAVMSGANGVFTRIWMVEPGTDMLVLGTSVGLHTNLDGEHSRVRVGERKLSRNAAWRQTVQTNEIKQEGGVDLNGD